MGITIKDIAKSAGVSYSTVSKALRDSPLVKPPTKKKIMTIARELGYQPNAAAQSLVSKRSHTIGVVWPSVEREAQAALITQLNEALEKEGYATLVSINELSRAIKTFQRFQVDAILVFNDKKNSGSITDSPVPILNYGIAEENQWATIDANRSEAIRMAIRHLSSLGYDSTLYVGMCTGDDVLQEQKFNGYKKGVIESFGPGTPLHFLDTIGLTRHDGYIAMKKFLKTSKFPYSIVVGSYDLARGSIQALAEDSRLNENGVAIISYDNLPKMDQMEIPMIKVGVPLEKIVKTIVDSLLKIVNNQSHVSSILLQPEIISPENGDGNGA